MSEWMSIESAPKDGTRVLTYREGFAESMAVAWYRGTGGFGEPHWNAVQGPDWPSPTHWQPLPPAPARKGGTK